MERVGKLKQGELISDAMRLPIIIILVIKHT